MFDLFLLLFIFVPGRQIFITKITFFESLCFVWKHTAWHFCPHSSYQRRVQPVAIIWIDVGCCLGKSMLENPSSVAYTLSKSRLTKVTLSYFLQSKHNDTRVQQHPFLSRKLYTHLFTTQKPSIYDLLRTSGRLPETNDENKITFWHWMMCLVNKLYTLLDMFIFLVS